METKNKTDIEAKSGADIKVDNKNDKSAKKPKNKKRGRAARIIGVVAVVAIVLVAIVVNSLTPAAVSVAAECAKAATGDVQMKLDSSGTIAAGEEKTYFAPVSAEIEKVNYQVGDAVSAGDLMLKFDQDDIDYQYQTAQLNGTASQYSYLDSINQSSQSASDKSTFEREIASLETSISNKEAEIANLESSIIGASGSAQSAASSTLATIRQQLRELNAEFLELKKAAITMDETDPEYANNLKRQLDIEAQISDLNTQAESLSASADTTGLESQLTRANSDLSKLQTDLATKESELSVAQGSILTSEAAAQLRATSNSEELSTMTTLELLDKAREGVVADFDGIVTSVSAVDGSSSVQGGELITIASLRDVTVNISVTKNDIGSIEVEQKATVTTLGNTYNGTVTKVSRLAAANENGNNVFEAEITISNPDDNIFLGADATVSVQGESVKNVVTVPTQAVNTSADGDFCYVVRDSVVEKQMIKTGVVSSDYTEITKGIKAGDIVVTSITAEIVEGATVTVNIEE